MKVFISSTYVDLIEYRKAATEALARLGHHVIGMETFNARAEDPTATSLKEVDECELFVGIYAYRYGTTIRDASTSVTEQEFDYATKMKKTIFAFFSSDINSLLPETIDKNTEQIEKLKNFKTKIVNHVTPDYFTNKTDLAYKIATSVKSHVARSERLRFFVSLKNYLARPSTGFPKSDDFDKNLVYYPLDYFEEIKSILNENSKCLLVGNSSSGKTVLAIAYAESLQNKTISHVQYGNASQTLEGDGREWYSHIMKNDRKGTLFILDNCHLAMDEVNELCFQLDETPPNYAQIILISRPRAKGHKDTSAIGDYYDLWQNYSILIKPENIYKGILEQYTNYYYRLDQTRYIKPQQEDEEIIKQQHSFSLVASKSRLTAWREKGGKLSDVTKELVYETLADKYLLNARLAMTVLCSLWQFEIPIHTTFIEKLLIQEEVEYLQSVNLVSYFILPRYGKLYYLLIHPDEAKEIFETNIYLHHGAVNKVVFDKEIEEYCFKYLATQPQNYQSIYDALYQQGYINIEEALLRKKELQELVVRNYWAINFTDLSRYLFYLSTVEPEISKKMLSDFIENYGSSNFLTGLLEQNLDFFQFTLFNLFKVDRGVVADLVLQLDIKYMAQRIQNEDLSSTSWLIRTLNKISHQKTQEILDIIPLYTLANMAEKGNIIGIERIISNCKRYGLWDSKKIDEFSDLLIPKLPHLKPHNFRTLNSLNRIKYGLRNNSPKLFSAYKKFLPTLKMESEDIANLMSKSTLPTIGYEIKSNNSSKIKGFEYFFEHFLIKKLSASSLLQISNFLSLLGNNNSIHFPLISNKIKSFVVSDDFQNKITASSLKNLMLYLEVVTRLDYINNEEILNSIQLLSLQDKSVEMADISLELIIPFFLNLAIINSPETYYLATNQDLVTRILSSWKSKPVWVLEFISICLLTDPSQIIKAKKLQAFEVQKPDLMHWLNYAVDKQLLLPLLLVIKGLRWLDEIYAKEIFLSTDALIDKIDWIDDSIDLTQDKFANELIKETRHWFGEVLFEDTIKSIDNLTSLIPKSDASRASDSI